MILKITGLRFPEGQQETGCRVVRRTASDFARLLKVLIPYGTGPCKIMLHCRERGMSACSLSVCVEREWTKELVRFKGGDVLLLRVLIFILIVVPIIEISGPVASGGWIGAWPTVSPSSPPGLWGVFGQAARAANFSPRAVTDAEGRAPGRCAVRRHLYPNGRTFTPYAGLFHRQRRLCSPPSLDAGGCQLWLKRWFNRLIRDGTIITIRRWH